LDSAAGHSSKDADFARELGLELGELRVKTLNYLDRQARVEAQEVSATLVGQDETTTFHMSLETVSGFTKLCKLWPWSKYLSRHPHLRDIPTPEYPDPPTGKILIGADNVDLPRIIKYRRNKRPNQPMGHIRLKMSTFSSRKSSLEIRRHLTSCRRRDGTAAPQTTDTV